MTAKAYKLTPVDTWFFRDGRPYNQGESTLANIKSLFPPFAMTTVGACRASLARSQGWDGKSEWTSEIKSKLGDGQNLGLLRFRGPYLVRDKKEGKHEILFPAPLNMLGKLSDTEKIQWEQLTLLKPGQKVDCDIGDDVRLPSSRDAQGKKSLYGSYLTSDDLEVVLKEGDLGKVCPVRSKDLWDFEYLVGLERDFRTHTAVEGALYSISRVRLEYGAGLAVEIDGLETGNDLHSILPFGGEGGLAQASSLNESIKLPKNPMLEPSSDGKIRFTVIHLTHACLDGPWPGPGTELPGIVGSRVVSACLERPVWIGGWDSINRKPLPLKPFLPGGSTWYCEADGRYANEIMKCNGQHIGKYGEFGYGEIAIGIWNDEQ